MFIAVYSLILFYEKLGSFFLGNQHFGAKPTSSCEHGTAAFARIVGTFPRTPTPSYRAVEFFGVFANALYG